MTRVRYNPKTGEIRRKPRAPAFIWLVRQERDQVTLPIRLETNSDYGLLVAYLNRYRAGDSRLSKLD